MFRTRCLACDASELAEIINLGMHPMADTFVARTRASEADRVYPLICDLCEQCGLVQLRTVTSPAERYVDHDYSYTSSNSGTSRAHWIDYASHVSSRVGLPAGSSVVEIGSNDGFLCAQFASAGHSIVGVDPSPAMERLASERNVRTLTKLFGHAIAMELEDELAMAPRLIVANNVFNHANDPADFVRGIKQLLALDGTFVFELPYWLRSISDGKFDQIYHEHVSYFTVAYADRLFRAAGMHVADVEEVDYHGGSIRVYVRHGHRAEPTVAARPFIAEEESAHLFEPETYKRFMSGVSEARDRFLEKVYAIRGAGGHIVCVGAAAKGNTFLNYYNLDASVVDYVTDSSETKQGKLTPRTRIPIAPDGVFAEYDRVHAIILSWNISAVLRSSLAKINPNIVFLNPYEGTT